MIINLTGTATVLDTLLKGIHQYTKEFNEPELPLRIEAEALYSLIATGGAKYISGPFSIETSSLELVSAALQVGFAAAVLPSSQFGTSDQSVDIVFAHWLASGLLWEKIRTTGGAYGAFSYPDTLEDIFVLSTYRDPSPARSLKVFKESLELATQIDIDPVSLEKTINGCYSREIQPRSPSDKGFTAFIRILYGITETLRRAKIERLVSVTPEDMKRCAQRLLNDWPSVRAALLAGKKVVKEVHKTDFSGKIIQFTV